MSTVFFTSDLHLGHRKMAELRGFGEDVEAHDRAIVDNWHRVVGKRDVVWVLGDIAMSGFDRALEQIDSLPGTKHLIAGNHDPVFPGHRSAANRQREFLEVFESVQAYARIRVAGHEVLLSHFPYATNDGHADHGEVRYTQYRLPDEGRWLLHGHTHHDWQFVHGKQMHVGLDAHSLKPVPLSVIEDVLGCETCAADRCCRDHRRHSMPHKNCILR